jgi:uncharacterized protein (DUF2267 family)
MNHDQFVGRVQHRAHLSSRGAAEAIIRATLETLGERLQKRAAARLAAQLPPEIARHLNAADHFEHLTLREFCGRVAVRENEDVEKALFHARCVMETLKEAISQGAARKLVLQMPEDFRPILAA